MKLIFAQGNPGPVYAASRHNAGFVVADSLATRDNIAFKTSAKFFADVAEFSSGDEKVLLAKPTTFYNETGRSFAALMQFYKLAPGDILVVHDELSLGFGTIRTRLGGSDAGNNGIKSVNAHGGGETARLRIGVSNTLRQQMGDVDFVLARFSTEERTVFQKDIVPQCLRVIDDFIGGNFAISTHQAS